MKQAATQALYAYWDALRAGRAAPERNAIDPLAIRGCLADTFMLELDDGAGMVMKLTGTRLNALFDRNLKGADFLSLWDLSSRADIEGLARSVMGQACILIAGVRGQATAIESLDLELLLLPLRHNGRTHARMLGLLAPLQTPAWISLIPLSSLVLTSWRLHGQEALGAQPLSAPRPRSAQPSKPGAAGAILRRGHLFVHDGGRKERFAALSETKLNRD